MPSKKPRRSRVERPHKYPRAPRLPRSAADADADAEYTRGRHIPSALAARPQIR